MISFDVTSPLPSKMTRYTSPGQWPRTLLLNRIHSMAYSDAIWERHSLESDKQWRAYHIYRDMTPDVRSIRGVCKATGYPSSSVFRWSRDFCWRERVKLWDEHTDQAFLSGRAEVAKQRGAELQQAIDSATELALRELRARLEDVAPDGRPLERMRDATLVSLLRTLKGLDALGKDPQQPDPNETPENEGEVDLTRLSDEEFREYEALLRKASTKG